MAPYSVYTYKIDKLRGICAAEPVATDDFVLDRKNQLQYFEDYFKAVKTKTVVVERDYIDQAYLHDFASYYVSCFADIQKRCTRLHFFTESFSEADFSALLRKEPTQLTAGKLQSSYQGFLVLKPLPETIIGRTCLETYGDAGGRRHFPILRKYKASLFGIDLSVDSLAFQEQDRVVAACATSALWSVFNQTGPQFSHPILSPVEITKAATDGSELDNRSIPNRGLNSFQVARAIRAVGLEPMAFRARNGHLLRSTLAAYLRGRVPICLLILLVEPVPGSEPKFVGGHAVAVTGFSTGGAITTDPTTRGIACTETRYS